MVYAVNRKLSYAVHLAIKYSSYNNSYQEYKFLHDEYICASFNIISPETEDWEWYHDCKKPHNYQEEMNLPDNDANKKRYKPELKRAQYLAIIKIVLTGDNRTWSDFKVDELTEALQKDPEDIQTTTNLTES